MIRARFKGGVLRQPGNAVSAALIAASTVPLLAAETLRITCPVAGLVTSNSLLLSLTLLPLI